MCSSAAARSLVYAVNRNRLSAAASAATIFDRTLSATAAFVFFFLFTAVLAEQEYDDENQHPGAG